MQTYHWTSGIKALYEKACDEYQAGGRSPDAFFTGREREALGEIGATPQELYDYAEDAKSVPWETALLIMAVRRDYFLFMQDGEAPERTVPLSDFPAKDDELGGIRWLPRLILKAECRLRGTLPRELMFCCGGDRSFFKKYDLHPADFLRFVWSARGDERKILEYVENAAAAVGG